MYLGVVLSDMPRRRGELMFYVMDGLGAASREYCAAT